MEHAHRLRLETLNPQPKKEHNMKFQLQFNNTDPAKWQTVEATNREAAIIKALRPRIKGKPETLWPYVAYVGLGEARHSNGAPICVQSYTLTLQRTANAIK